jgi:pilus assembly protein CpaC
MPPRPSMRLPAAYQVPNSYQAPASRSAPDVPPQGTTPAPSAAERHIELDHDRIELVTNSSLPLRLDRKIPKASVSNPDIAELTALSPNQILVLARKPGVTAITLWDETGKIYTVDCVVYGNPSELAAILKTEFPDAHLGVKPLGNDKLLLSGYVDGANQANQIMRIAASYYNDDPVNPKKVISNIQVGGVQQILLHVKVVEVDREKIRNLGFDFASLTGGGFLASSISNLLAPNAAVTSGALGSVVGNGDTLRFGIVSGNTSFFGFLDALRREDLLKILADPTLVTVSGRPAQFHVGGEIPYPSTASLNAVTVSYKDTGITIDFVPIVLGNGNIRLEVRPVDREIDDTITIQIAPGFESPAFTERHVDTGVEMRAGQTLAIAGLVSKRLTARTQEIPWIGELPYVGAAFRHQQQKEEEIELLFLVTPEVVAALDPCETPQCFPGMHSDVPNDVQEYWKGYIEVPSKGPCGPCGCPGGPDGGPGGMMQGYEEIGPGTATTPAKSSSVVSPPASNTTKNGRGGGGNADNRNNPQGVQSPRSAAAARGPTNGPGLVGPVGYDVLN